MQKKNKIILTIFLAFVAIFGIIFVSVIMMNNYSSKSDGKITIAVIDEDGKTIKEKDIDFNKGDKLEKLILDNFDNVTFDNGMIMTIETLETPSDWSYFICIYVDGLEEENKSMVGYSDIEFKDGTKIYFVFTELIY